MQAPPTSEEILTAWIEWRVEAWRFWAKRPTDRFRMLIRSRIAEISYSHKPELVDEPTIQTVEMELWQNRTPQRTNVWEVFETVSKFVVARGFGSDFQ